VIDTKQDVLRYIGSLKGIPPEKVTQIMALIDKGDYATAQRMLNDLARNRASTIDVNVFAHLTVPAGTPGTIRTYLPVKGAASASPAVNPTSLAPGATAAPAQAATSVGITAPVIVLHSPMIGNPAHVADAVLAGYLRAVRLNGPRQVTTT
jgi:hypothetical protein